MQVVLAILALTFGLLLGGCEDAQSLKAEETRGKLVGTWLREMEHGGDKARRVLVLSDGGKFSETLAVQYADGRTGREQRSGEWSFDGVNLKRRYTHEDGRQLSGNFRFVTFALTVFTDSEFEGRNHAHGEEIHYRRVAERTMP